MKELIMSLNHWWGYLIIAYYITWVITWQLLLYKADGVIGSIWAYMKFLLDGIAEGKIKTIGDSIIIIFTAIVLIISTAWLILCWTCLTIIGFMPVINHCMASDFVGKTKETFPIKAWILLFSWIGYILYKIMSIRIRPKIA